MHENLTWIFLSCNLWKISYWRRTDCNFLGHLKKTDSIFLTKYLVGESDTALMMTSPRTRSAVLILICWWWSWSCSSWSLQPWRKVCKCFAASRRPRSLAQSMIPDVTCKTGNECSSNVTKPNWYNCPLVDNRATQHRSLGRPWFNCPRIMLAAVA